MRFKLKLLLVLSAIVHYSVSAQGDISLPRGDAGRTGEFNVLPIESFGTVVWKSPKIANFQTDARGLVISGDVLGERVSWSRRVYTDMTRTGMPEISGRQRLFIGREYRLPAFGRGRESSPLMHRKSLIISINVGSSMGLEPDGDGFLVSVDAETGKPNFVFKCGTCNVSNPVGYGDVIIITTREMETAREGSVKAISPSTGKVEWSYPVECSLVTPTVHDGILYFLEGPSRPDAVVAQSAETLIHAFDLKSRKIRWTFKAKGTFDTPAISDGVMFAASNRDYIYAIDLSTGKEKWRFKAEAKNPAVRNGSVFFSDSSSLYALDSTSGALKWKTKIPGGVDQALAVSKSRVFFSSGNNRFLAVDATSGQIAWSVKIEDYSYEPVISRDRVFVGGQRELLMLDTETGKKFETVKLGRDVAFTPVLQDGTAIIYNGDGYFFAMKK